jgi:hypothetical protein
MNGEANTPGKLVVGHETFGELSGTLSVRSQSDDAFCRASLEEQRWRWDRRSETSETTAKAATKVEHPEVKSRRSLNEDASGN